ncbi:hypothetical protein LSTR_LSTR000905 [Laodelphax striatellus]|uniref:Uncharacterized protein n=1 Tax=Laodelphax striatellus TaxID=195883 RepID=A0A482X0P5_LAOST|nr:hypothetical protein LSTR_LSTR000905 [Laodelphax striatellus]
MGCASSAPFNPGAVANDAPTDAANGDGGGGGFAAKLRRNASDIVDTTASSVMGEAERIKDGAVTKMQDMGETIQETAEEAVDKVTDKLTSTFKDLTSAAEEKAAEVEEGAAEAETAIAEAKARAEEDIENEVRNMVEDLEQELPPPDMPPSDGEKPAASDSSQHLQDGDPQQDGSVVTGVIITELASDEAPPDTAEVNLGFVEVPSGSDGELLGTPRDALEREIEGSPPPSAIPRPASALQENIQPHAVPFPFANLTEATTTNEQKEGEETGENGGEEQTEAQDDETRAESPAYEEIINVESNNDNASISELNNNEPIKDEGTDENDDATLENNNIETVDNPSSPVQNETTEEPATNEEDQKDENDNDKEKEEDDSDKEKEENDDGTEKDVENS